MSCLQLCCHAMVCADIQQGYLYQVQRVAVSVCMQAYVHELGQCLLKVDNDKHGLVTRRLLLLSVEGMRLVGRRLLYNPAAHKAVITANLVQGQPTLLHLDADFYTHLVVSSLHWWNATEVACTGQLAVVLYRYGQVFKGITLQGPSVQFSRQYGWLANCCSQAFIHTFHESFIVMRHRMICGMFHRDCWNYQKNR